MLKQKSNHFIVQFVIAPVKCFRLVKEMQECTTALLHRKKTKKQPHKCKEDMLLKTYFCYLYL